MQKLTIQETEQVNGDLLPNAVGAVTRAVGAIMGTIISGGSDVDAEDNVLAGVAGAVAGAVNPVHSIAGVVKVLGGSIAGGGTVNVIRDIVNFEFSGA